MSGLFFFGLFLCLSQSDLAPGSSEEMQKVQDNLDAAGVGWLRGNCIPCCILHFVTVSAPLG